VTVKSSALTIHDMDEPFETATCIMDHSRMCCGRFANMMVTPLRVSVL